MFSFTYTLHMLIGLASYNSRGCIVESDGVASETFKMRATIFFHPGSRIIAWRGSPAGAAAQLKLPEQPDSEEDNGYVPTRTRSQDASPRNALLKHLYIYLQQILRHFHSTIPITHHSTRRQLLSA